MKKILACITWIWLGISGVCFAQEPDLRAKVRSEAPNKWAEYLTAFSGRLRESSATSYTDWLGDGKPKPRAKGTVQYGTHGALEYHQKMEPAPGGGGYAFVLNEQYAFEVKRKSPEDQWLLVAINLEPKGLTPHMEGVDMFTTKALGNIGPFYVGGGISSYLPEMFKKTNFQITRASPWERDSRTLVRFEFRLDTPAKKSRPAHTYQGWVVLDPDQFWRVCESEIQVDYADKSENMVVTSTVECKMEGEYPTLTKWTIEGKGTLLGKPFHQTTIVDYTVDRNDPDASEFRLTAFGLKEPMGVTWSQPTRWWLWLSLSAVGAVALGVLLIKVKRRSSTAEFLKGHGPLTTNLNNKGETP
jgi:hypothetical protein